MVQQVMTEPGTIEFKNISVPEIGNNGVLIKIMRIGICGSDIHVYHGQHPYTSYPVVQDHEVAGILPKTVVALSATWYLRLLEVWEQIR